LPGELWGVTTYFNPAGFLNKLDHLRLFSERLRQQGLRLLVVEAAFDGLPFVLDQRLADLVVRVRPRDRLWQKERLLNLALDHLPDACDKVTWLDADILLENDHWVRDTAKLLQEFVVVQPFDVAWWLPPGLQSPPSTLSGDEFVQIIHGLAHVQSHPSRFPATYSGHPGFGWAARRSLLDQYKFYDRLVLGGGDVAMCWGMYDQLFRVPIRNWMTAFCTPMQIADVSIWKDRFHTAVRASVSYVPGRVFHLWHGALDDRQYHQRHLLLKRFDFDPRRDIVLDEERCWCWNSEKPELHQGASQYFQRRNEDA
jgi:hypothetical protein